MVDDMLPLPHDTIRRVTEHFQADPRCLALIVGGSVAKRRVVPNSDLDTMLIVSAEVLAQGSIRRTDHFVTSDLADASLQTDGKSEVKLLDWQFLGEAAERLHMGHLRCGSSVGDVLLT